MDGVSSGLAGDPFQSVPTNPVRTTLPRERGTPEFRRQREGHGRRRRRKGTGNWGSLEVLLGGRTIPDLDSDKGPLGGWCDGGRVSSLWSSLTGHDCSVPVGFQFEEGECILLVRERGWTSRAVRMDFKGGQDGLHDADGTARSTREVTPTTGHQESPRPVRERPDLWILHLSVQ